MGGLPCPEREGPQGLGQVSINRHHAAQYRYYRTVFSALHVDLTSCLLPLLAFAPPRLRREARHVGVALPIVCM
jgi:hypothetical protein